MDEKKKKIVISIVLIVVFIFIVTGISYAAFRYVGQGEEVNQITTGTIRMNYEEGSNVIRLNNALPTRDATGKVRLNEGEYFDFSVTTNITGDAIINWEIAAEDFIDNTFDGANVKFYLTKIVDGKEVEISTDLPAVYSEQTSENNKTGRPINMMSLLTGTSSTQGEETINYRLRLYVTEEYNPQGDGGGLIFKTRINVYGKVSTEKELPVLKQALNNENFYINEYKNKITSIVFKTDTQIPNTALQVTNGKGNYWDVSVEQDDGAIAYIEDDNNSGYKLTIGGEDGVAANSMSGGMFGGFKFLISIEGLNHLDTSNVTNMQGMFSGCSSLTSLDLSSFNTSNVTTMQLMFYNCNSLTSLNLNGFDTTSVTNMQSMFYNANSLTSLDLSSFDTSKIMDMTWMFRDCFALTSLNLSSFDTSNVTRMELMFENCNSLVELDLNNFNTLKVYSMMSMFSGCSSLTTLDLSNFNTSKVTNMQSMFSGCSSLTNLNLSSFDTSNVTRMNYMFENCNSLTSLDLRNFDTSKVTTMLCMFRYCNNLTSIIVSNLWIVEGALETYMFSDCGTDHVTVV